MAPRTHSNLTLATEETDDESCSLFPIDETAPLTGKKKMKKVHPREKNHHWLFWLPFFAVVVVVFHSTRKHPKQFVPAETASPSATEPPTTAVPTFSPTAKPRKPGSCPLDFQKPLGSNFIGDSDKKNFAEKRDENLILCDSFDDAKPLGNHWLVDQTLFGEGNGGFAYYTADNVAVEEEQLRIRPGLFADLPPISTQAGTYDAKSVMLGDCKPFPECATLVVENCTINDFSGCQRIGTPLVALNPVTSGRLSTRGRFQMQYGRMEARIRLPAGDWLWPAFWMMPANASKYGGWPKSGEIDLLESKGNDPDKFGRTGGGRNLFSSCMHYAGNAWWKTRQMLSANDILEVCRNKTVPLEECDWSKDFFTIGLYWSPTRIYTYALRHTNVAGNDLEEEVIIWDVDATTGFGPNDYPMGSKVPPLYNEAIENTPNEDPNGPYIAESKNKNAPFDQPFYININLNVGGEAGGCPNAAYWGHDAVWCTARDPEKPDISARTVFWDARDEWYPSWEQAKKEGSDSYAIDWIKVWQ